MSKSVSPYYDSETGDVIDPSSDLVPAVEPLRVPGLLEQFMADYIPVDDECSATDVLSLGRLREVLCAYMPFGSKEDPLQDYLDRLASEGFYLHDTSSGPALCLVSKRDRRVINSSFSDAEEMM